MVKNGSSSKPEKMVKNKTDLKCSPYRARSARRSVTRSKPAAGSSKESPANVKVVVRVRPPNSKELGDNSRTVVNVIDDNVIVFDPKENHEPFFYHRVQQKGRDLLKKENKNIPFTFDKVFGYEAKNADVFEDSTKSLISTLMDGYNCSVFVYGATGAGKTHTMLGHTDNPGITFLTMKRLFDQIEELKEERNFELGITYLEVYNETVKDLLNPGGPLHLREDGNYGVCVAGIKIHRIQQPNELFSLLEKGNVNRTQHPTDANAESSRSHAVFQVYVNMTTKTTGERRIAKLSMIDLAGSERGAATGCTGMRFTEGANINKSLLALGNCINSLADGHRHIPYRDSKLTRLLKDSLGGNCKTVMIANISPSSLNYEDTYNTLKYATRAKKIKSNMKKNVVNRELSIPQYVKLVEELTRENELLKEKLEEKNQARTCSCKTESGGSKKKSPKSETEPAWLEKYRQLLKEKRNIGKRIQQYLYKEDILQMKVKFKESFETHTKKLCSDDDQLDTHMNKILSSVNVFQRQVSGLLVQIDDLQKDKDKVNEEITALIEKENISKDNIDLLKSDLELQESLNEIATNHIKKLSELFQCEMEHRDKLVNKLVETVNMYFHLLRGHGHMTIEMSDDYRGLIRLAQGIRTVSWQDEAEANNIKTEVSSELKRQNRTNLTELQKRLEVIEETYSTKLARRKLYDDDTVASCLTSNDNEEISSESDAPASELNKTISLPQPTIDSDVINSTFHIVNKDPPPPVAKKIVLKESNTVTANNLFKAYKHSAKRIPLQSPGRLTKENATKNSTKAFSTLGRTQRFPLRKNQDTALKPGRGTKIVTSSIRTPKGSKR